MIELNDEPLTMYAADIIEEPEMAAFVISNAADFGVPITIACADDWERETAMAALQRVHFALQPCQGRA